MERQKPRNRGRPAKAEEERKGANFTFRVSPELRSKLQLAAKAAHRSVSSEIERTLLDHYRQREEFGQVARLVGAVIRATEEKIGKRWFADNESRRMCRIATDGVLNMILGLRPDWDAEIASLKSRISNLSVEERAMHWEDLLTICKAEFALEKDAMEMVKASIDSLLMEAREAAAVLSEPPAPRAKSKREAKQ
jgi:hypothetical protein